MWFKKNPEEKIHFLNRKNTKNRKNQIFSVFCVLSAQKMYFFLGIFFKPHLLNLKTLFLRFSGNFESSGVNCLVTQIGFSGHSMLRELLRRSPFNQQSTTVALNRPTFESGVFGDFFIIRLLNTQIYQGYKHLAQ